MIECLCDHVLVLWNDPGLPVYVGTEPPYQVGMGSENPDPIFRGHHGISSSAPNGKHMEDDWTFGVLMCLNYDF